MAAELTPDELRSELSRLGLSQVRAAKALRVDARTMRRWALGELPIPHAVALLLPKLTPREAAKLVTQSLRDGAEVSATKSNA